MPTLSVSLIVLVITYVKLPVYLESRVPDSLNKLAHKRLAWLLYFVLSFYLPTTLIERNLLFIRKVGLKVSFCLI